MRTLDGLGGGSDGGGMTGMEPRARRETWSAGLAPGNGSPLGRSVVVIGDLVDSDDIGPPGADGWGPEAADTFAVADLDGERARLDVTGGYLERLPLACVKAGIADRVEIWHHRGTGQPGWTRREHALLTRRAFPLDARGGPIASASMRRFLEAYGPPAMLVVLGLGVDEDVLEACRDSFLVYNSIDAPALRVPDTVARRFDLVLTGAQWQSDVVAARAPGVATAILPIGPEFAAIEQFRPLGTPKTHDLVYVAAAQAYKRHDILFDALERLPRSISALCVFGYGEMADELRGRAAAAGLNVDFVGPPGVPFDEVNRLMNRARIGVVCGVDDGAPAILTEYMLAGLPVLANADLCCGLQFIRPDTGMAASADRFADAIVELLARAPSMAPRDVALQHWTWPHSIVRFAALIHDSYTATPPA